MRAVAGVVAMALLSTSCAFDHHYYSEDWEGSRFYETKSGEKIKVTSDGSIWNVKEEKSLGNAQKNGADWDLAAYDIEPARDRCYNPVHWDKTVSCSQYVLAPVTAVAGTFFLIGYFLLEFGISALDGQTIKVK